MPRPLRWFTTLADAQTVTSGGQSQNELLQNLSVDQRRNSTITRIILQLVLANATIDKKGGVKWGITNISEDAFTAGAFPDADVALDDTDWLVRGAEVVAMSDLQDGSQMVRVFRDIGTSRILHGASDQTHFIIDQNTSATTINYDLFTRILVRLP